MSTVTIVLLVVLVLLVLGSFPSWPYSRGWSWGPASGLGLVLVVVVVLLLAGVIRAQDLEGASGAVVVDAPLTTPTVQPIVVDQQQWWSPLIGPAFGLFGVACTVGGLFLWQLLKRSKAQTSLVEAMARAAIKRTEERVDEKAAIADQRATIDSMAEKINGGQMVLLEKVSRLADRIAVLAPSKASTAEAASASSARNEHAAMERAAAEVVARPTDGVTVGEAPVTVIAPKDPKP